MKTGIKTMGIILACIAAFSFSDPDPAPAECYTEAEPAQVDSVAYLVRHGIESLAQGAQRDLKKTQSIHSECLRLYKLADTSICPICPDATKR